MSGNEPTVDHTCPECGQSTIEETWQKQQFHYGSGDKAVNLSAHMPVMECSACGFQYSDERGEVARHESICRYLGVLSPLEIVSIREFLGLSRMEFAELVGVGIASLQRWESGSVIQNVSIDRLFRLMRFRENVDFLRGLGGKPDTSLPDAQSSNVIEMPPPRKSCGLRSRVSNAKQLEAAKAWRLRG